MNPPTSTRQHQSDHGSPLRPIYVDLDGSLIASDSLWDTAAFALRQYPAKTIRLMMVGLLNVLFRGEAAKARLKAGLAELYQPHANGFPLRDDVVAFLEEQKKQGRSLILASAANNRIVTSVAQETAIFDHVIGSDHQINLRGKEKLRAIREHLNSHQSVTTGFAYLGNAKADVPIWKREHYLDGSSDWLHPLA